MSNKKLLRMIAVFFVNLLLGSFLANYVTNQQTCLVAQGCVPVPDSPVILLAFIYTLVLWGLQKTLLKAWREKSLSKFFDAGLILISPSLLNGVFVMWRGDWEAHHILRNVMMLWSLLLVCLQIWLNRNRAETEKTKNEDKRSKKFSIKEILIASLWVLANFLYGYCVGIYFVWQTPCTYVACVDFRPLFVPPFFALIFGIVLWKLQEALTEIWCDKSFPALLKACFILLLPFVIFPKFGSMFWGMSFMISITVLLWSLNAVYWQLRRANSQQANEKIKNEDSL